jgi:hypothetical protein
MSMKRFIPREKLGRKARKQLDSGQRATWAFSPVTKKVESKKLYNRKRKSHDRYDDYGMGFFVSMFGGKPKEIPHNHGGRMASEFSVRCPCKSLDLPPAR